MLWSFVFERSGYIWRSKEVEPSCETQGDQGGLEETQGNPALPKLHLGCGQQTYQLCQPSSPVVFQQEIKHAWPNLDRAPNRSCLFVSIRVYFWHVSIRVCFSWLFLSENEQIRVYPCLSMSIRVYSCLSPWKIDACFFFACLFIWNTRKPIWKLIENRQRNGRSSRVSIILE